jgi:hypothetical protein
LIRAIRTGIQRRIVEHEPQKEESTSQIADDQNSSPEEEKLDLSSLRGAKAIDALSLKNIIKRKK